MVVLLMILIYFIPVILMILNMFISKKEWSDRKKISSFECGFDMLSMNRLPFSIHFYLIGILFLIFDIEVIYFLPVMELFKYLNICDWFYLMMLIIMILYMGLEFEKNEGSLKWFF